VIPSSPHVRNVTDADFEREVIEASRQTPVVVDFWAPWCQPCLMLAPLLERLVAERDGAVLLAKVNIDESQQWAGRLGVESIPAVKAFRDGRVVMEFVGLYPEPALREFLDRLMPSEADRAVKDAEAITATDPTRAEALYRQALEKERGHAGAILGLAALLGERGDAEEAGALLERIGHTPESDRLRATLALRSLAREFGPEETLRQRLLADPENPELHYQLGCALAAAGRYRDALESFLAAAERDRALAGSRVKEAMVKVFQVVGVRNELADEYRRKLTRLLY
jgi:putative thioredoxin